MGRLGLVDGLVVCPEGFPCLERAGLSRQKASGPLPLLGNGAAPTTRKDVTPLNRKSGGLMEQNNASLQRGDQG